MNPLETWAYALKRIFKLPASIVLIVGDWKTGKTDFALLLYEELKRRGIIRKAASNVQNFKDRSFKEVDNSKILCIQDMQTLKAWMFQDSISKLFIYDESITATPRRRAMSKLNVAWLKEIIPELSKGRGKLIVISQELEFTESVFYHPTFMRGMFRKINKKMVILNSPLLQKELTFYDIPRTSIGFDPYRIAIFRYEGIKDTGKMTDGQKVMYLYAKGLTMQDIGERFDPVKHRMQVSRILRKYLQSLEENSSLVTYNSARDSKPIEE